MMGLKVLIAGYVLYLLSFCQQSAGQTETSGTISENLHPVESCPADADSWRKAGIRLKCPTDKYGRNLYQCAPNEYKTDLVEFCLKGSIGRYEEGLCVFAYPSRELHVDYCETFVSGCPENSYIGDEIYKYPACLEINREAGCYVADPKCPPSGRTISNPQDSVFVTVAVVSSLSVIGIVVGIILLFWCRCREHRKRKQDSDQHIDEGVPLQERGTAALKSHDTKHIPFTSIIKDTPEHFEYKTNDHQASDADTLEKNRVILYISDDKSSAGRKMNALDSCGRFGKSIFVGSLGQWELEDDISLYLFRQPLHGINSTFDLDEISDILKDMYRQTTHTPRIYFVLLFNTEEWRKYGTHLSKYDFFNKAIAIKDR